MASVPVPTAATGVWHAADDPCDRVFGASESRRRASGGGYSAAHPALWDRGRTAGDAWSSDGVKAGAIGRPRQNTMLIHHRHSDSVGFWGGRCLASFSGQWEAMKNERCRAANDSGHHHWRRATWPRVVKGWRERGPLCRLAAETKQVHTYSTYFAQAPRYLFRGRVACHCPFRQRRPSGLAREAWGNALAQHHPSPADAMSGQVSTTPLPGRGRVAYRFPRDPSPDPAHACVSLHRHP